MFKKILKSLLVISFPHLLVTQFMSFNNLLNLQISRSNLIKTSPIPFFINKFKRTNNNLMNEFNLEMDSDKIFIHTTQNKMYYTGSITQDGCYHIIKTLAQLEEIALKYNYNNISFIIQSPGGTLLPALGVIDAMSSSKVPIHTYVNGFAASAASLISVCGHKRFMGKNSLLLIHSLRMTMDEGNFNNLEDNYMNAVKITEILKKIYLEKSILTENQLDKLLEHDLWLNSDECLELKLIDNII